MASCARLVSPRSTRHLCRFWLRTAGIVGQGTDVEVVPEELMAQVETEKIAQLVLYLSSETGSIVNGACWTADGGCTAN